MAEGQEVVGADRGLRGRLGGRDTEVLARVQAVAPEPYHDIYQVNSHYPLRILRQFQFAHFVGR